MSYGTVGPMTNSGAAQAVAATLEQARSATMLRLVITGSVDDGKSTLIGRLVYDSKQILTDQLEAIRAASERRNGESGLDLSLLTDGLRAEREQGITIDVAYRYFQTQQRKFIIADTPGHERYTRNMVTGASTADLAVILIDARKGVVEQTRRHAFIASLLGIRHLVVCVNKMDLVGYAHERFEQVAHEFSEFCARLETTDVTFIPTSRRARRQHRRALGGDGLVSGTRASVPPRARSHLLGPQPDRLPVPGAVGDPARAGRERPRLPRLRGPDRGRRIPCRRSCGRAAGRRGDPDRLGRHIRGGAVGGVRADVGDAAARRRRRRLSRGHDLPAAQPPDRRPPSRGDRVLDGGRAGHRRRGVRDQAHQSRGAGDRRGGALPDRRQHAPSRRARRQARQ